METYKWQAATRLYSYYFEYDSSENSFLWLARQTIRPILTDVHEKRQK